MEKFTYIEDVHGFQGAINSGQTKKIRVESDSYGGTADESKLKQEAPDIYNFYQECETAGTDCHSFVFQMLNKIGLHHSVLNDPDATAVTNFPQEIKREDFELVTEMENAVARMIEERKSTMQKGFGTFTTFWQAFTYNFFQKSKESGLNCVSPTQLYPHTAAWELAEPDYLEKQKTSDTSVMERLLGMFKDVKHYPKVLTVTLDHPDGSIRDLHTSLIIGPATDEKDFWALEREQIGQSRRLVLLSQVVKRYNQPVFFRVKEGATLNFSLVPNEQEILDSITPEEMKRWVKDRRKTVE